MSDLFSGEMTTAQKHNADHGVQNTVTFADDFKVTCGTGPPPIKKDETSFAILRKCQELVKYYYAPGMHPATFELKLDQLGDKADKEIAKREAEIKR